MARPPRPPRSDPARRAAGKSAGRRDDRPRHVSRPRPAADRPATDRPPADQAVEPAADRGAMRKPRRADPARPRSPIRPAEIWTKPEVARLNVGQVLGAALSLLDAIDASGHGADRAAATWFRANRRFDGPPRGDIMDLVDGALRHRAALDWWTAREGAGVAIGNRARLLAAHLLVQKREVGSLERACDGIALAPAPLDDAERRFLEALKGHTVHHPGQPLDVRAGFPAWLEPHLRRRWGDTLEGEMTAMLRPASVDLRANVLKTTRDKALDVLGKQGLAARPTPLSPLGLRLGPKTDIGKIAALADGLVEVQDEGSQLAALLVDARTGQWVIDFCAGAGGKTMVLAGAMANRGHIVALDVNEFRLSRARQRLRRAGAENVECRAMDAKWVKRQAGRADRVLVDAPCTGTGTWRRKPDARWRLQPADLAELVPRQAEILDRAAKLVKPGGRLVYVTCSLLAAENEEQIAAFLARHADYAALDVARLWPDLVGGAAPAPGPYLQLTPARHGTDGFFVAVLEKTA